MRSLLIFAILLLTAVPARTDSTIDNALTVHVARGALGEVMQKIAREIDGLKTSFPQLKNWEEAYISSSRIEYQYHYDEGAFGKNGCRLLIVAKTEPVWNEELKVGVYLKMKAVGEKAALLKKTLMNIVGREFEKIRSLRKTT